MYDWSASTYNLTITSSIFPIYFTSIVKGENGTDIVNFLGFQLKNSSIYSYSLSFIFLFVALTNPFLTSISDFTGRKKSFMKLYCFMGAASCSTLYFFDNHHLMLGVFAFILAGIGYNGSWVFYNSYLPEITTPDKYDNVSAKGFSFGYIGSVILLLFNLSMLLKPDFYGGIDAQMASKISFLSVGIWWFLFSLITFYLLPADKPIKNTDYKVWIFNGFKELKKIFIIAKKSNELKYFLFAFFLYNLGVQTTMYVATIFAEIELHLPADSLIATVLILQFVAIPGAYFSSVISNRFSNITSITIQLFIWIGICLGAYFVQNEYQFYVVAFLVGWVMGGIQSISRSTFAKFIPKNKADNASFFSFYEFVDKLSIVVGTLIYALCDTLFSNGRIVLLILAMFFMLAIFILKIKLSENKILLKT